MQFPNRSQLRLRVPPFFLILSLLGCLLLAWSVPLVMAAGDHHAHMLTRSFKNNHFARWTRATPPIDADCRSSMGTPCYAPNEMQNAYNLTPILRAGFTGAGQTIVVIDSFGSPTVQQDLHIFDSDYNLPDPPSFQVLTPLGSAPFDPNNTDQVGWAQETSLDIQWAHAMAPDASIVLLTSPTSETQGVQGMPEFLSLELYAVSHHLGNIIAQSWGTTENTLFTPQGEQILNSFNSFYQVAAQMHITILAAAGDSGVANPDVAGNTYPFPTVGFPASSPWVTTIGGTSLYADTSGAYQHETAWNQGMGNATGGGVSQYFRTPGYQLSSLPPYVSAFLHGFRAVPDVAYNADPTTSIPVYMGFLPGGQAGYYLFGGTSEGVPTWAGLVADANQMAGHPLGFLNDKLYALGRMGPGAPFFHDIVVGNNSQGTLSGYSATPGWDAVTGWGTPDAFYLLKALV